MRTVPVEIPEITLDRDEIKRIVRHAAAREDDAGNDWSRLVTGEIPTSEGFVEFLHDMFVLLRTTAGIFGEASVDGQFVYDVALNQVEGVVLAIPVATEVSWGSEARQVLTVGHTGYVSYWKFYPEGAETALDFAVETLMRIGDTARRVLEKLGS
jgi:hypothetical protein